MKYNNKNLPIVCMQTNSSCYKGTTVMPKVLGILWHSTGVNNPNIKRYVQPTDGCADYDEMIEIIGKNPYKNDWNHITRSAGLNAWIGKLANGTVAAVQTMPWDYAPWGCGSGPNGSCNKGWIQFEICEDRLESKEYFDKVYKEAVELTAYLCKMYNLNPLGTVNFNQQVVPVILSHADSHKLGLGSNHGDVQHWFNRFGKTMDDVRRDVNELVNPKPVVVESEYYPAFSGLALSLDSMLRKIGVPEQYVGNYKKRKPLAEANGITGYVGSAKQNSQIKSLAKAGKLKKVATAASSTSTVAPAQPVVSKPKVEYYPKYTGDSSGLDTILRAIGVPNESTGGYKKRKPLAELNGITNYTGSADQNTKLKQLARTGKLKKIQ